MKKEAEKSLRNKRLGQESKPVPEEGKERETSLSVPPGGESKASEGRGRSAERSYK